MHFDTVARTRLVPFSAKVTKTFQLALFVSAAAASTLSNCMITINRRILNELRLTAEPAYLNRAHARRRLQPISFVAPAVERPRRVRLSLTLRAARGGATLAENSYDIYVYPKPMPAREVSLIFHDPANDLRALSEELTRVGYRVATTASNNITANVGERTLMIAWRYDQTIERHLQAGGRVLLLADARDALPADAPLKVVSRAGSDLDGNWVTNFNWVNTNAAPFRDALYDKHSKILGFEAENVTPRFIIQGVPGANYDDALAGIFYGWLNNNAVLAAQMNYNKGTTSGKLLATTFRFQDYGRDAFATRLLDSMIRYAASPEMKPQLQLRK